MKKLKHGIIGFGFISEKHMRGYASVSDRVETVAVCDILPERLEAARAQGIERLYDDYHAMLAEPDIDIVSVCLPNYLHKQVTIDALEAGKHVHCEKPMAMNYAEALEMLAAQKRTGKNLMIGLNNRYVPINQYIRKYVQEGNIGEVYFAKCGWTDRMGLPPSGWFTDVRRSGGGAVIDTAVHYVDLVMQMLGYPAVESVTARTFDRLISNPELAGSYAFPGLIDPKDTFTVEDLGTGIINLSGRRSIVFEHSWASNIEEGKRYYALYGTRGGVSFENDRVRIFKTENGTQTDSIPVIDPGDSAWESEFAMLPDAIEHGRDISSIPQQAAEMMRIIDAIYASSASGQMIRLDEEKNG